MIRVGRVAAILLMFCGLGLSGAAHAAGGTKTLMYVGKRLAADGKKAEVIIFIDLNDSSKTVAFTLSDFQDIDDANIRNLLKTIVALPHRHAGENSAGAFLEVDSRLILSVPLNRPEINTQSWRIVEVNLKPVKLTPTP